MLKRRIQYANNHPKVKVITPAYHNHQTNSVWFITMAAATFAAAFYFFSFFFGFTGGRTLTKS